MSEWRGSGVLTIVCLLEFWLRWKVRHVYGGIMVSKLSGSLEIMGEQKFGSSVKLGEGQEVFISESLQELCSKKTKSYQGSFFTRMKGWETSTSSSFLRPLPTAVMPLLVV
jgi:hypothetical protein